MRGLIALLAVLCAACGSPPSVHVDAGVAPDAGPVFCTEDGECDDTIYCNGRELCRSAAAHADARGCVPARVGGCAPSQTCDEANDRCQTLCDVNPDADGDGVVAIECGGTDCDDADPLRFPGNIEVCDAAGHDEDCDPTTFGARDQDGDGAFDAACCNYATDGTATCGTDCNDHADSIHPGAPERCDLRDQDCDGLVDEGVMVAAFADADRDLHGDPLAPIFGCPGLPGVVLSSDDCDDTRGTVYYGAPEICDGLDNDCNGLVDDGALPVTWYRDRDGDGFGSASSGTVVSCVPPVGYSIFSTDCDDDRRATSPLAREACNGIDDDCSGSADFVIGPGDTEDDDGDGYADARCGAWAHDCDDNDPFVHPGAPELCNLRDDDCDGAIETDRNTLAWYPDRDGDGAGEAGSVPVYSCDVVLGRVTNATDCDDRSAAIGPFALDACGTGVDGVDDDCDGRIDEDGGEVAFYVDADGDGFGGGAPLYACVVPPAHLTRGGDCDDTRSDVHPGLTESCAVLDEIDNDCDGFIDCEDSDCVGAALCGPPVTLTIASGDGQTAMPGLPLDAPLVVRATTATGVIVAGAIVHFRADSGASVRDGTTTTDAAGLARTYVRVGLAVGAYAITASATGAATRAFTATAGSPPDGFWSPMLDADRLGSPGTGPTGLIEGASALAARPHSVPPTDAMRFVSIGLVDGLVVPLPDDDCVVSIDGIGVLHVIAGKCGVGGRDDGDEGLPGPMATLDSPTAVALDAAGHRLFIADYGNARIRALSLDDGTLETVAGGGIEALLAVRQSIASRAVALPATRLAFDPRTGELWTQVGTPCVRVGLTTNTVTGVSMCPNDYPHPGLSLGGSTILARAPLRASDLTEAPGATLATVHTTPFGMVSLAALPLGTDVGLPPTATFAGGVVDGVGRTSATATFMSLGPTTGTVGVDVWTHPEAGSHHLDLVSVASPGDVFYASSITWGRPAPSWLINGAESAIQAVAVAGDGVVFSFNLDVSSFIGRVDLGGTRLLPSPGTVFAGDGVSYGAALLSRPHDYQEFRLANGSVTRSVHFGPLDSPVRTARALDGTLFMQVLRDTGGYGTRTYYMVRVSPSGAVERLTNLELSVCPYMAPADVSALAVEPSGALWMAGIGCPDEATGLTYTIIRRNTDGTLEHVAFRADGVSTPGTPAPMLAATTSPPVVALAPDGSMIAVGDGLYRIDPVTLSATPVTISPDALAAGDADLAFVSQVTVDLGGHIWLVRDGVNVRVVW